MFPHPFLRTTGLTLALASLAGAALAEGPKAAPVDVIVEGMGASQGKGIAAARKAAISDALRIAVETKMGVNIKGSRFAEMYMLKKDRIEAHAEGTVESYEILEEKPIGTAYWVRIKAKLRPDAIQQQGLDKVQVALMVKEIADKEELKGTLSNVEMAVKQGLTEAGLRVVPAPTDINFGTGFDQLMRAAQEASLDLLISVQAVTSVRDDVGGLILCRSTVDLSVTKPYTKEAVIERRLNVNGKRRPDVADAAESAQALAGKQAADYLVSQVLKKSRGLLEARVFLSGLENQGQVDAVREALLAEKSISNVEVKFYAEKQSVLLVQMDVSAKEKLGAYLRNVKTVPLTVDEHTTGWVQAHVKQAEDEKTEVEEEKAEDQKPDEDEKEE